ncbi:MAG: arginyltransferase [Gemmataceae bacterium]
MESLFQFVSPPSPCGYLPDRLAQYENELIGSMTPAEYQRRMEDGWRRFGRLIFRPRCHGCRSCESLRIDTACYRPDRSQRRNRAMNEGHVLLEVGEPDVDTERLDLYDRYHTHQTQHRGWPGQCSKDAAEYYDSFVDNPFPAEEWRFRLDGQLVGVGYVDRLPTALSAIYFYYDPDLRDRGLGTWNVQSVIERAADQGIPYVYLGYFVDGSASLAYKANFRPNQVLRGDDAWHDYRL